MILLEKNIDSTTKIGIWEIQNSEAWFLDRLELADNERNEMLTLNGKKRLEWLADRYILHLLLQKSKRIFCKKDEFGKPFLADDSWQISFSNSQNKAAAIISTKSVGIDIQYFTQKIERIAARFLSEKELKKLSVESRFEELHVFWGAKEAMYKAYGKKELDFRLHMSVEPFEFDKNGGKIIGKVQKDDFTAIYDIFYEVVEDFMLVSCVTSSV